MNEALWPHEASPWHAGEQALQRRVGALGPLAGAGRRIIRAAMPQQHRDFFEQLPFIVVGAADETGQPWATVLTGAPGFVQSPAEDRLQIAALPAAEDPLQLHAGQPLALLGIEPPTRRRNRANGMVEQLHKGGFELHVRQSFGNCPQYIHRREPLEALPHAGAVERGQALQGAAAALVARADTFFIATQALPGEVNGGADVSHRGGPAGFVRVSEGGLRITWPDYAGNRFFNTLGNLQLEPRAGLLFVDWASGTLLHVAGRAKVLWDSPEVATFEGAQRLVQMDVQQWLLRPALRTTPAPRP